MCPPVSPCKGASIVKSSYIIRDAQIYFGMETPLRGRSDGHTGAAPTVSFGQIVRGTVDFVWVDCAWPTYSVWVSDVVQMSLTRVCEWLWENQACRACTFDSPGLATIGAYPGERWREKIYAIGIVLSLNSFEQKE